MTTFMEKLYIFIKQQISLLGEVSEIFVFHLPIAVPFPMNKKKATSVHDFPSQFVGFMIINSNWMSFKDFLYIFVNNRKFLKKKFD
jgi:hypothetical protein